MVDSIRDSAGASEQPGWFRAVRDHLKWLWLALGPLLWNRLVWLVDEFAGNWATDAITKAMQQSGAAAAVARFLHWVAVNPVQSFVVVAVSIVVVLEMIGFVQRSRAQSPADSTMPSDSRAPAKEPLTTAPA